MARRIMFVAAVLLAFFVAATANATNSRINSFGGGTKAFTVMDDRNIFFLPAELVHYGNWAALELGDGGYYSEDSLFSDGGTSFAFHYQLNEDTVIGMMGSNVRLPGIDGMFPNVLQAGSFANWGMDEPNHRGSLFFAKGNADQRFGARFGIYGQSNKDYDYDPDSNYKSGPFALDFGAGAGFAAGGGTVDFGVGYMTSKAQDESSEAEAGSDNTQSEFGVIGRGTFPAGQGDDSWVPFVAFSTTSAKGQLNAAGAPEQKGSATGFMFGTDLRIQVSEDVFIQPGLGIAFSSWKEELDDGEFTSENKESTTTLPFFNLAAEIAVWDWMTFRFGGSQYVTFVTDENIYDNATTDKDEYSTVSHSLATGLAVNLPGDVIIDIQVDTDWWRNGPYVMSGDSSSFGLNAAISKGW